MPRTSFSPPSPDHLNTLTVRTRASGLQHVVGSHALAVSTGRRLDHLAMGNGACAELAVRYIVYPTGVRPGLYGKMSAIR